MNIASYMVKLKVLKLPLGQVRFSTQLGPFVLGGKLSNVLKGVPMHLQTFTD